jgi:hypothetical protein
MTVMLDPWYVTGFCDGEAAFTYSRSGGSFEIYFGLRQREDNAQIIQDIYVFFHCVGKIYRCKAIEATLKSGLTQPTIYFRATKADDLKIIIEHFDKYPLRSLKKKGAYDVWREMVIYKSEHYRDVDYNVLRPLADKLSTLNSKSRLYIRHKK